MRKPLYVRELSDGERERLEAGLRSKDVFELRHCQMLLASSRGAHAIEIAEVVGCHDQTVRNAIKAFNERGLEALKPGSRRPHHTQAAFTPENAQRLREMLHHGPRDYGKPTSIWTLDLAAEVSFEQGLTATLVTGETVRVTLLRMGVRWQRAKHWITSPDPAYERKKSVATA